MRRPTSWKSRLALLQGGVTDVQKENDSFETDIIFYCERQMLEDSKINIRLSDRSIDRLILILYAQSTTKVIPEWNTSQQITMKNRIQCLCHTSLHVWRDLWGNEVEWTGKVEVIKKHYSWQQVKHAWLYSDLLGSSADAFFISAPAVLILWKLRPRLALLHSNIQTESSTLSSLPYTLAASVIKGV